MAGLRRTCLAAGLGVLVSAGSGLAHHPDLDRVDPGVLGNALGSSLAAEAQCREGGVFAGEGDDELLSLVLSGVLLYAEGLPRRDGNRFLSNFMASMLVSGADCDRLLEREAHFADALAKLELDPETALGLMIALANQESN